MAVHKDELESAARNGRTPRLRPWSSAPAVATILNIRGPATLSGRVRDSLSSVFATDAATGKLRATGRVKEQFGTLVATNS